MLLSDGLQDCQFSLSHGAVVRIRQTGADTWRVGNSVQGNNGGADLVLLSKQPGRPQRKEDGPWLRSVRGSGSLWSHQPI